MFELMRQLAAYIRDRATIKLFMFNDTFCIYGVAFCRYAGRFQMTRVIPQPFPIDFVKGLHRLIVEPATIQRCRGLVDNALEFGLKGTVFQSRTGAYLLELYGQLAGAAPRV